MGFYRYSDNRYIGYKITDSNTDTDIYFITFVIKCVNKSNHDQILILMLVQSTKCLLYLILKSISACSGFNLLLLATSNNILISYVMNYTTISKVLT